ncbi:diacylglycerol/lipid kinase family protein [Rhodohalobacter mucosus]|uniref:DAGKc domain-containing protein n=1 Tax=Rhodohalobacter mucosus TaxID=2079485 RepID=A0A316TUV8_9BACT|nr:diacylglycerol kinase family protein [Rhodohalobacter mucosus]PWN07658.1 hypothetical protein DDZ15_01120 [Rhodohalobacter mucosus]
MEKSPTSVCFILNPAADKSRSARHAAWLRRQAEQRWHRFEVVLSTPDEPMKELAAKKAAEFDVIVACGGDGTVHQVVNGIAGIGTGFAVLPVGTGNDFAKSLNLPESREAILDLIQKNKFQNADLIRFKGDSEGWCVNTLGIGLDGLANHYSKSFHRIKGFIIYVMGALKASFKFRGALFSITSGPEKKDLSGEFLMVTVCNGKWEGGTFYIAPGATLFDGRADLVTVDKISVPKILLYMSCFKNGPATWMNALNTQKVTSLNVHAETAVAVHADGEQLGTEIHNLYITVERGILPVIAGH